MSEVVTSVSIFEFIRHFEFQLAKCLAIELGEVNETISVMFRLLKSFKADECDTKVTTGNDPKLVKIAENIDSILSQFGSYPPVLPHAEFIDEFIHKIRKKFKNIENSGVNSSGSGGSGSKGRSNSQTSTSISSAGKTFVGSLLAEADSLESLKAKQLLTCQYLSEIKASVHTPLQTLLDRYSKLPPAPSESNEVVAATQAVENIENQYKNAKSTPMFVKMVTNRLEAECIENKVFELLEPLRVVAKLISQPSAISQQRETVWSRSLLPLLACPTGELLARCCHKSIMENFASSVLELQAVLKNAGESDGASLRRKHLFGSIDAKNLIGIEQFDIELFAAHLDDWRVRVCEIEIQSNSSDFTKAYKDLVKVRANLKKSSEAYEKKLQAYNNSLANYAVVEGDMKALKKKLEEICAVELKASINVVLPEPQGGGCIPAKM